MDSTRMPGSAPRFVGATAALFLVSGCEMMTPPEENPTYLRLTELDNRVDRVERIVRGLDLDHTTVAGRIQNRARLVRQIVRATATGS